MSPKAALNIVLDDIYEMSLLEEFSAVSASREGEIEKRLWHQARLSMLGELTEKIKERRTEIENEGDTK
jgi:hypothetical protein